MSIFFNRFRRIPIFFASILVALFVCPGYSNQITSEEYATQKEKAQEQPISNVKQAKGFHKQTNSPNPLAELSVLGISEGTSLGQTHDRKRSVFRVLKPHCAEINFKGKYTYKFSTKRAQERLGNTVHTEKKSLDTISVSPQDDRWKWKMGQTDIVREFDSIEALLVYLKGDDG